MPLPERELIKRIRAQSRSKGGAVRLGIGDDCAVVRPPHGHELLVTSDLSLEGVHFRRDWHSPEVAGHRCLTRGLSDIAAMGGEPLAVFLSVALPAALPQKWANDFLTGFLRLAKKFKVPLAGGDTAQSLTGVQADVVVLGSAPRGRAILRSGAKPGDYIYVTGTLGGSAAAIHELELGRKVRERDYPQHFEPMPRIAVGKVLGEKKLASAMIDLSDGLSVDLAHICEESGVRAVVDAASLPSAKVGRPARAASLADVLHGGEDYELLFTAPENKRISKAIAGVPITRIGTIVENTPGHERVLLMMHGVGKPLKPHGWEHFRK